MVFQLGGFVCFRSNSNIVLGKAPKTMTKPAIDRQTHTPSGIAGYLPDAESDGMTPVWASVAPIYWPSPR